METNLKDTEALPYYKPTPMWVLWMKHTDETWEAVEATKDRYVLDSWFGTYNVTPEEETGYRIKELFPDKD